MGKIGFMQGRLSPLINGRIQAFPWQHWRDEFILAQTNGFNLIEWTLDQDDLYKNPIMTVNGRREIRSLSNKYGISIESLTGDCFMQSPFYKATGSDKQRLINDLQNIVEACLEIGIKWIVFPLVDNGRLENTWQEDDLKKGLSLIEFALKDGGARIVFESDFTPRLLKEFIVKFPQQVFGINYDIGNSASQGYGPAEEINEYSSYIYNVHVKDRLKGGGTVPLGAGNADLPLVFRLLRESGYVGNFILQTARAVDGEHAAVLCNYREMVQKWLDTVFLTQPYPYES